MNILVVLSSAVYCSTTLELGSNLQWTVFYLSIDDCVDDTPGDDAVHKSQVECRISSWAEVEVLIATTCRPKVDVPVVNNGNRGILYLDTESLWNIVGERFGWWNARRRSGRR